MRFLFAFAVCFAAPAHVLFAQPAQRLVDNEKWPMEEVLLQDGTKLRGLIESESRHAVDFLEIHRPPGRATYLVGRIIDRRDIDQIHPLPADQRKQLQERIFLQRRGLRAEFEMGQMSRVDLTTVNNGGMTFYHYSGDWFEFDSTAAKTITQRCVVRLEQMFMAYRYVLPPRRDADAVVPFRIVLFGSNEQYFHYLRQQQVSIVNPSYFDVSNNLVVVGSDVNRIQKQVERATARHNEVLTDYQDHEAEFREQLTQLNMQLQKEKIEEKERVAILNAARARWREEFRDIASRISVAERKNRALLDDTIDQLLKRLYHEAFHAYLENYVYDSETYDVPRWLNEGLAQIFEVGILDGGRLRVDAPRGELLAKLQNDLQSDAPLRISDVLAADQVKFLVPHRSELSTSRRHYLYSWGLAYFLAFQQPTLTGDAMDQYVDRRGELLGPQLRFSRLIDMPLDQFERIWREQMLDLKPPR